MPDRADLPEGSATGNAGVRGAASPPQRGEPDVFHGPRRIVRFSERIAAGLPVEDDEIAEVLGAAGVGPFRYADGRLADKTRDSGEPARAHSVDAALRAVDLGYPSAVAVRCLLHDVVEETCGDLVHVHARIEEITRRFSVEVAHDVLLLTNRYDVLLRSIAKFVPTSLPFEHGSVEPVLREMERLRTGMADLVAMSFGHEFARLREMITGLRDFRDGLARVRHAYRHTFLDELRLLAYRLYLDDIGSDATWRANQGEPYLMVATVKLIDLVDNLRTMGVTTRMAIEKCVLKATVCLDSTMFLAAWARSRPSTIAFALLRDFAAHTLVEQLLERQHVLAFLGEGRMRSLGNVVGDLAERMHARYGVPDLPIEQLGTLREAIQEANVAQRA